MPDSNKPKDRWDKADIILKPVGGLSTSLAAALIAFIASNYLQVRETRETNARVYADIISQREEADSQLRSSMFVTMLEPFVTEGTNPFDKSILSLELLAYNFHEALDLGPLFKNVQRTIRSALDSTDDPNKKGELNGYLARLEAAAKDVTSKQIAALEEPDKYLTGLVRWSDVSANPGGVKVIQPQVIDGRRFQLEVLNFNLATKQLRVLLKISEKDNLISSTFWLSFFDFPMIDNTRLSGGWRCAVVLKDFSETGANLELVYFDGSKASLKERQFVQELIDRLLLTRETSEPGEAIGP